MDYLSTVHAVVETPGYLRDAEVIFSQAERDRMVVKVATDPECGELIPGTGGFRKMRVARGGMGKRGGARVVYILRNESFPIFLTAAYAKNEKANLTQKERNELAALASVIFSRYRSSK